MPSRMIRKRLLTWRIGAQCARQHLSAVVGIAHGTRAMKVGECDDNYGEGRGLHPRSASAGGFCGR